MLGVSGAFLAFLTNLDRMIALVNAIMYIPNNVLDITLYNELTLTKCVVQVKVLVKTSIISNLLLH